MPCDKALFDINGSLRRWIVGRHAIGFGSISQRRRRRSPYPSTMSSDFENTIPSSDLHFER